MRLRSALPIRTKIASLHHRYNIRSLLDTPWYSRENLWSSNGRLPKAKKPATVVELGHGILPFFIRAIYLQQPSITKEYLLPDALFYRHS